jgi:hypothetical protein
MENQEQAQVASTEGVGGEMPTAPQPELSINDLQNLRAIIDTAAKRGAFQANEMAAVGSVYDRLNTFLVAVLPKPQEAAPAAAPEASPEATA